MSSTEPRNAISLFISQHCKNGEVPEKLKYRNSFGVVHAEMELDMYGGYNTMPVEDLPLYIIKVLDRESFNDINKTISTLREYQKIADSDAPKWR